MKGNDDALRDQLCWLLDGGGAHVSFEKAVSDLSTDDQGRRPASLPYSPWEVLEHMRIAQWDIVRFCQEPAHESPEWPAGYWPQGVAPPDEQSWTRSVAMFQQDLATLREMVTDSQRDPAAPLPAGEPYTLLREVLLVADHNAYHLGQLVAVRRALGAWRD